MKLYAKILPEYFDMLDYKTIEFRQIEELTLENSETHEQRSFKVENIRRLMDGEGMNIKKRYPKVSWDTELPIYAIDLGDEMDRNDLISVPLPAGQDLEISDRNPIEYEKPWYAVGD